MNDLDQFKNTYITECFELLSDMEEHLLSLDVDGPTDKEKLNAIFRCAHSIKGGAGAFGFNYITNFTHVLEALLDSMREGKIRPTREAVDTLLKAADIVTQMVTCANENKVPADDFGAAILEKLLTFANMTPISSPSTQKKEACPQGDAYWKIVFSPHQEIFESGNEPLLILRELAGLGKAEIIANTSAIPSLELINPTNCYITWTINLITNKPESSIREVFEFVEDCCDLTIEKIERRTEVREEIAQIQEEPIQKTAQTTSIRVDIDKVDRLVNMVGELVITGSMMRAQTRRLPLDQFSDLLRSVEEISQHTRELQESVMSIRMQPVKSIFSRMPRIVRDLSTQLGKDIRLEMHGENTEVDKTVIEQLGDPLTHMIRNSIDHGIEKPEDRLQLGKHPQGTVHLSAHHRAGRIIIEIKDDGAGINRPRVLKKAIEKGLVKPDAVLSDEECDQLIFLPGFSTAEVVSNVSGRGVGMDVVKRNIQSINGQVSVKNEPGKGSTFTVSLPLTLAILDGMIVRVGSEDYIIPINSIIETLRPVANSIKRVEGHGDVMNIRGEFVPITYLHKLFNIPNAQEDANKALIVLVECGREKMGIVVDELVGQQQVVIKSLEDNTDPVKGISGATILGDGRVSLILEVGDLKSIG